MRVTEVAVHVPARERRGFIAWALVLTSVALVVVTLDNLVVTPAFPAIQGDFQASIQSLEWSVSAFAVAFGVVLLMGTALADRFGAVRTYVGGLAIFVAASAGCGLAPNVELFDAARAVQGVGAALVVPLTFTLARNAFSGARRELALGSALGLGGIALLAGPLVGGVIAGEADWRWMFWLNVPVGIAALLLVPLGVGEIRGPHTRIDAVGLLLAAAGVTGLLWGLTRGPFIGWTSHQVLTALGAGALLTAGFFAWEAAAATPMLPLHFLREQAFAATAAASLGAGFALFGSLFLLVQFLEAVRADSTLRTGLELVPAVGAALVLAPVAGALSIRWSARPFVALGLLSQACALAWFAHVSAADVSYQRLIPGLVLLGAGVGLFVVPVARIVGRAVRPEEANRACAANSAFAAVGGAFGVAGLTAILLRYGSYSTTDSFINGFDGALWFAAGVSAAASLLSLVPLGKRAMRQVDATVVDERQGPKDLKSDDRDATVVGDFPRQPVLNAGDRRSTVVADYSRQPMLNAEEVREPSQERVPDTSEPPEADAPAQLPDLAPRRDVATPEHLPEVSPRHEPARTAEADAFPCPVCLGEGWFTIHPPQDPRTETCKRCYGHGSVLTGSHVPEHMVRECPDCEGRGYIDSSAPEPRRVHLPPHSGEVEPELYTGRLRRPADAPSGGVPE